MKPNHYLPFFTLLFSVLASPALSQNQQFPTDHRMLCAEEKDGSYRVFQMIYDSNSIAAEPFKLHHIHQREIMECDSILWEEFQNFSDPSSFQTLHFTEQNGEHSIYQGLNEICTIRLDAPVGTQFTSSKGPITYYTKTKYQKNGLRDSVLIFYPAPNGIIDFSVNPLIIGQTIGWIEGGDFFNFTQLGYWDASGKYAGVRLPVWQDFFPEEAGDMKMWVTTSSIYGTPVSGHLDSFLKAERFTDSIRYTIRSYPLNSDWTWGQPNTRTYTERGFGVKEYLNDSLFACLWAKKYSYADVFEIRHLFMQYDIIHDEWTLNINFEGYHQRKCPFMAVIDGNSSGFYSEKYGYEYRTLSGYSHIITSLHGVKVGNNSKGNLNVGFASGAKSLFKVYPNPSSDKLFVTNVNDASTYIIYSTRGEKIDSGGLRNGTIPIDHLKSGIYILKLLSGPLQQCIRIQVLH